MARVWTGRQAIAIKLIDQIADFQAAVQDTAKSVGIEGEPTLVMPEKERKSLLDLTVRRCFGLYPRPGQADAEQCRVLLPLEIGGAGTGRIFAKLKLGLAKRLVFLRI